MTQMSRFQFGLSGGQQTLRGFLLAAQKRNALGSSGQFVGQR